MQKSCFTLCFLLLLPGLPWGLWAQNSAAGMSGENSENALNRLIEISTQLSNLNERLRNELQDSRQSSRELQTMLESSRKELGLLQQELVLLRQEAEALQNSSTELLMKAENSETELTALMAALRKAESSLMSLELSFASYRETAERRINSLERMNRFWKWGFIAAGVLAAGFGAAFIAGR